ncbi:kinase-like protein [Agrocybe pediades]|nr:kinase-like protein [Agrocybe pediades]
MPTSAWGQAAPPRKSKTLAEQLKSLFHVFGKVTSSVGKWWSRWQNRTKKSSNRSSKFVLRVTSPVAHCRTVFPYYIDTIEVESPPHQESEKFDIEQDTEKEAYVPWQEWDAQNPTERYASLADLCAHVGNQLPSRVVKLVARDILRCLDDRYRTHCCPYGNISFHTILLSPTDLRSLISQLREDMEPSFEPTDAIVGLSLTRDLLTSDTLSPVFTLSEVEDEDQRPEYPDHESLLPPEEILGGLSGTSADMWALGCILFELLTGEALFDPIFQTKELGITKEESHLIQMIELFGEMPVDVIKAGRFSGHWFTTDGRLRIDTSYYPIELKTVLERHIVGEDLSGAAMFLEKMLKLQPNERAQPRELMDDPWFSE